MIGTHNSLTFCEPRLKVMKLFTWLWRCQTMNMTDQLWYVDYFDIRIRWTKKGELRYCHGLVDLQCEKSLDELLEEFMCWGKRCRIVIERGDYLQHMNELERIVDQYAAYIDYVIVKKGWVTLYRSASTMKLKDYTYIPFYSDRSFWQNMKTLKISTIKRWAKKNNPKWSISLMRSKTVHFVDYFTVKQ